MIDEHHPLTCMETDLIITNRYIAKTLSKSPHAEHVGNEAESGTHHRYFQIIECNETIISLTQTDMKRLLVVFSS